MKKITRKNRICTIVSIMIALSLLTACGNNASNAKSTPARPTPGFSTDASTASSSSSPAQTKQGTTSSGSSSKSTDVDYGDNNSIARLCPNCNIATHYATDFSSVDPDDYWVVAGKEYDLIGYLSNFGEVSISGEHAITCAIQNGWRVYLSKGSDYGITVGNMHSMTTSASICGESGHLISIVDWDIQMDEILFDFYFELMPRLEKEFNGHSCPMSENGHKVMPHWDGICGND